MSTPSFNIYNEKLKLSSTLYRDKLKLEIIDAIYGKGGWINYSLIKDHKITIHKTNTKYYSLRLKSNINTSSMLIKVFNSLDECIEYIANFS
jgi:hypothetical protein